MILVDGVTRYGAELTRGLPSSRWCHMVSDTSEEELHAFAARIGLKREWAQLLADQVRLLGTDLTGPDIAGEQVVSLKTVRTHTKNIFTKLGVNTRRAAVRRAAELNLL